MKDSPNCRKTYADCPIAPGCVETSKPWRCSANGACVSHFSFCPFDEKVRQEYPKECDPISGQKYERCFDAICRPEGYCKCLKYSGCQLGMYQCPNGSCAGAIVGCTGMGRSTIIHPISCGNNTRRSEIKKCSPVWPIAGVYFKGKTKIEWNGQNYPGQKT